MVPVSSPFPSPALLWMGFVSVAALPARSARIAAAALPVRTSHVVAHRNCAAVGAIRMETVLRTVPAYRRLASQARAARRVEQVGPSRRRQPGGSSGTERVLDLGALHHT